MGYACTAFHIRLHMPHFFLHIFLKYMCRYGLYSFDFLHIA